MRRLAALVILAGALLGLSAHTVRGSESDTSTPDHGQSSHLDYEEGEIRLLGSSSESAAGLTEVVLRSYADYTGQLPPELDSLAESGWFLMRKPVNSEDYTLHPEKGAFSYQRKTAKLSINMKSGAVKQSEVETRTTNFGPRFQDDLSSLSQSRRSQFAKALGWIRQVRLAYRSYYDTHQTVPLGWDEVRKFLKDNGVSLYLDRLKDPVTGEKVTIGIAEEDVIRIHQPYPERRSSFHRVEWKNMPAELKSNERIQKTLHLYDHIDFNGPFVY